MYELPAVTPREFAQRNESGMVATDWTGVKHVVTKSKNAKAVQGTSVFKTTVFYPIGYWEAIDQIPDGFKWVEFRCGDDHYRGETRMDFERIALKIFPVSDEKTAVVIEAYVA